MKTFYGFSGTGIIGSIPFVLMHDSKKPEIQIFKAGGGKKFKLYRNY